MQQQILITLQSRITGHFQAQKLLGHAFPFQLGVNQQAVARIQRGHHGRRVMAQQQLAELGRNRQPPFAVYAEFVYAAKHFAPLLG